MSLIKNRDLFSLLLELSDSAFDYCRTLAWPACDYQYLKCSDLRIIDLMEKGAQMRQDYFRAKDFNVFKPQTELEHFLKSFECYFSEFLYCSPGTRASKYVARAMYDINFLKTKKKIELSDFDCIMMIFVSLLRYQYRQNSSWFTSPASYPIRDADFGIETFDGELLEKLRTNDIITASVVVPKDYKKYYPNKVGKMDNSGHRKIQKIKNYYHLLYSVILSNMLDSMGLLR